MDLILFGPCSIGVPLVSREFKFKTLPAQSLRTSKGAPE